MMRWDSKRSVRPLPCSGEQRRGVAARFGSEHVGEVGEEGAALQPAGLGDGEQPFDRVLAVLGLAAERELAVDDGAAQAALGMVVGGLDAVDLAEGPKRRPELEQVLGEGAVAATPGAPLRRLLEQRPELLFERRDLLGKAGAVGVPAALIPGGEQPSGDLQAGRAELLLGGGEALTVGGEVPSAGAPSRPGGARAQEPCRPTSDPSRRCRRTPRQATPAARARGGRGRCGRPPRGR